MNKRWLVLEKALNTTECRQLLNYVLKPQEFIIPTEKLPNLHKKVFNIVSEYYDLSSCSFIEQWYNTAHTGQASNEHIDKDEELYWATGETRMPLCSAIMYINILGLRGANLELTDEERPGDIPQGESLFYKEPYIVTPKEGTIVLLEQGVWHRVSPYVSGHRTALLFNFWDGPPLYNS